MSFRLSSPNGCTSGMRTIHSDKNYRKYKGLKWIREMKYGICNAYPIHDWLTTDVWVANGRYHWDYNKLYDLYYRAGVPLDKQRVASPFISQAISSLRLYRVGENGKSGQWGEFCRIVWEYIYDGLAFYQTSTQYDMGRIFGFFVENASGKHS